MKVYICRSTEKKDYVYQDPPYLCPKCGGEVSPEKILNRKVFCTKTCMRKFLELHDSARLEYLENQILDGPAADPSPLRPRHNKGKFELPDKWAEVPDHNESAAIARSERINGWGPDEMYDIPLTSPASTQ